jgi:hypothetical protein
MSVSDILFMGKRHRWCRMDVPAVVYNGAGQARTVGTAVKAGRAGKAGRKSSGARSAVHRPVVCCFIHGIHHFSCHLPDGVRAQERRPERPLSAESARGEVFAGQHPAGSPAMRQYYLSAAWYIRFYYNLPFFKKYGRIRL